MEPATLVFALIGCVVAYVVLAAIRAVFFPPRAPKSLEYKPRQVGKRAHRAPPSRRRLPAALAALSSLAMHQ